MDFMLRYYGPLPSNGSIDDKHRIRIVLHNQLVELCRQDALVADALNPDLPQAQLKGRKVDVPRPMKVMYFYVSIGGYEFVPLIHRPHEQACALEILFLRRERPGDIVRHGGDLDNRLKTLFDALRMPLEPTEVCGLPPSDSGSRMLCLLEDDSLITKIGVTTHQLLEPMPSGEDSANVELLIHATVLSTYPIIANLGF